MSTGLLEWSANACGKYSRCRMLLQGWSQVAKRREHITPILRQLHLAAGQTTSWIQDGQLGIASVVKPSTYLSGWRYSSRLRKFCSLPQVLFDEKVLRHSCSLHSRFGDRCFAAAGPRIWNNLPVCDKRKSAAQNSENNWKHSCFRQTAAHRDFFDYCAL